MLSLFQVFSKHHASNKATLIMDALELTGFGPRTAQSALMLHDALCGLR